MRFLIALACILHCSLAIFCFNPKAILSSSWWKPKCLKDKAKSEDQIREQVKTQVRKAAPRYNYCRSFKSKEFDIYVDYAKAKRKDVSPATYSVSGEVNFFHARHSEDPYIHALGLAQGESDWMGKNEDSAIIAREFCHAAKTHYVTEFGKGIEPSPVDSIQHAYKYVLANPRVPVGSLSAIVVSFDISGVATLAAFGQVWGGLFRNGELISQTNSNLRNRLTKYGRQNRIPATLCHVPWPTVYQWDFESNDIIVLVTKSIYDILGQQRFVAQVKQSAARSTDLSLITDNILKATKKVYGEQHLGRFPFEDSGLVVIKPK